MADILHLIRIAAPVEQVFHLLATGSGVATWWTPDVELDQEAGGEGIFRFYDGGCATKVRIETFEPPTRVAWRVSASFRPEWLHTDICFALASDGDGTTLRFAHRGFPRADDDYALCTTGWGIYLDRLRRAVERDRS